MKFSIEKKLSNGRGRAGVIETRNGKIETPAYIVVGTKATIKALTPEQVLAVGTQAILANTYHLYLEPGEEVLKNAGGFAKFMNWKGPTFTDSGGFQAFSLGAAFNNKVGKIGNVKMEPTRANDRDEDLGTQHNNALAKVDEEGVTFKSIIDGSSHRFTPERSMEIQHAIGADIMFAFDECTSPLAPHEYQKEAMDRTHRWAKRSLDYHRAANTGQALFGIVQGGRFEDLRKESARIIGGMDFDGFGIGGSFDKEDLYTAVGWVADELPEGKPRHLLGIGEPVDLILGIENGMDTFDCVVPTRIARNGTIYTRKGKIHIANAEYKNDFGKLDDGCGCYTCTNYSRAYVSHLFRVKEMLASTLGSIHNLYFLVNLVKGAREAILNDTFPVYKKDFLEGYKIGA
jgi:queuine tRNA-ribosyltransferase